MQYLQNSITIETFLWDFFQYYVDGKISLGSRERNTLSHYKLSLRKDDILSVPAQGSGLGVGQGDKSGEGLINPPE